MLWEDTSAAQEWHDPGDIVDAVFAIACRSLPVDHAWALSQEVQAALPWFAEETAAGLHPIHGAASGSGWMRPEGPDALLQLSRRARLVLRLPRERLDDATALVGRTLDVAGWPLRVDSVSVRPLARITTLFARGVMLGDADDESVFLAAAARELETLGIAAAKMLCGRESLLATPRETYRTRSLMLAELTPAQSIALQRQGLGEARKLGCGVFIPHKDIADVRSPDR